MSEIRRGIKSNPYRKTVVACRLSYLVQGIVNNFAPLLFLTFKRLYGLTFDQISAIIALNFGVQVIVDYLSAKLVDYFGYRKSAVASQMLSAMGLIMMGVLPGIINPYAGILISVFMYAIGSGLIETAGSPILQACPIENKDAEMSMLHSNYCWGHVLSVIGSSLFFVAFGTGNYKLLSCLWAVIPLVCMIMFIKVPMCTLADANNVLPEKKLLRLPLYKIMILLMFCSGAAEQCISQWISTYAEAGLGISKTVGDLAGACTFAICMGGARIVYGKFSEKIDLNRFMIISGLLCVVCYLVAAMSPDKIVSLVACVLSGVTVGIMWPGVYSISANLIPNGGTGLFAYLALAGDIGCMAGPTSLGVVAGLFGDNLNTGILFSVVFPVLFVVILLYVEKKYIRRSECQ